jgi:hypothetical protein
MSQQHSTILDRIVALYDEQRALWARSGRGEWLDTRERDRLSEIARALEALWNRRRMEKAGADPDGMAEIVYERDGRTGPRFEYRRGRFSRAREVAA